MTQVTGKSGRYRYYKCTTRMAKNLAREQTDALVLDALADRVFAPKRVSLMLKELVRRQQRAKTATDACRVASETVTAPCATLEQRLTVPTSGLGKA